MSYTPPNNATLRAIFAETKTIACVGVSTNPVRPSYFVARYLVLRGFKVIPVNPAYAGQTLFGAEIMPSLANIPKDQPVDMVDIFRRSSDAGAVVDEAMATLPHLRTIWMQIGVIDEAAGARAIAAGLRVVMDRCPKIEYQRLFGELRMGGFNTGLISSKL
ncbi:MAG: CoA-binding protein [Paracoccaceae bacterium]